MGVGNQCGDRIRQLRKSHNWKQEDLAERLHITDKLVSKWENYDSTPTGDMLIELSKVFSVTTDYILGVDNRRMLVVEGLPEDKIAALQSLISGLIQAYNQPH